jgi:hypothetical protein
MVLDLDEDSLHRPQPATLAPIAALRAEQVVGMGYFPNELGLPVSPPAHAVARSGGA